MLKNKVNAALISTCILVTGHSEIAAADTLFSYVKKNENTGNIIEKKLIDETQASFSYGSGDKDYLTISNNNNLHWMIGVSAENGKKLTVGTYLNAAAYSSSINSALVISGSEMPCNNPLASQFKVLEIEYGSNKELKKLALDFTQQCNLSKKAIFGALRYNSSVPNDLDDYIYSLSAKTNTTIISQPGEFVGSGTETELSDKRSAYRFYGSTKNHIHVVHDAKGRWDFDFAAPKGNNLSKGLYEHATRYPFQSESTPGLNVDGNGSGCSELSGRFKVLDFDFNTDGSIKQYAIDFVQRCTRQHPALIGALRYNSLLPIDIYAPATLDSSTGEVSIPYAELGSQFKEVKLSIEKTTPLTLKITKIGPTSVKSSDIRVPAYFDSYHQKLSIPQTMLTDVFGKKHLIKNLVLKNKGYGIKIGSLLVLDNAKESNLMKYKIYK